MNKSVSKIFSSLFLVVVLGLSIGCEQADMIAGAAGTVDARIPQVEKRSAEIKAYADNAGLNPSISDVLNMPKEVRDNIIAWRVEFNHLAQQLKTLASHMEGLSAEQRAEAEKRMSSLRSKLTSFLAKDEHIQITVSKDHYYEIMRGSLQNVQNILFAPSQNELEDSARNVLPSRERFLDLCADFEKVFSNVNLGSGCGWIRITLRVDERITSRVQPCQALTSALADSNCRQDATNECRANIDLNCVSETVDKFFSKTCRSAVRTTRRLGRYEKRYSMGDYDHDTKYEANADSRALIAAMRACVRE